jgi:putative acetyltransferase
LNTELCGCGGIVLEDPDYAEVKRLYVSPRCRGHGIAQAILQRLEQSALSLGIDTLRLETGIHQPEALALFTAFGFNRSERFGNYPADDPNSVFMEKCILA